MVTRKEIEELVVKAQKEIDRVIDYVVDNDDMFSIMDLKMHDAFCYSFDANEEYPFIEDATEEFYNWCEETYYVCNDDLRFEFGCDISDLCHHIGRTSQFYLLLDTRYAKYGIIHEVLENIDNISIEWLEFDENNQITIDFDNLEDNYVCIEDVYNNLVDELELIIDGEVYNALIKKLTDDGIISFYNTLSNLKENQVEIFKEYLEYRNNELKEEAEDIKRIEEALLDKKLSIKNKYSITDDDWKVITE